MEIRASIKRIFLASLTSLSLLSGAYPALAQSDATQSELSKGVAAMQSGNLDAAEKAFQKGYDLAVAAGDQGKACQAAFQLGIVKTSLHKSSEAEKLFQTALQLVKGVMPPNSPFESLVYCLLADLYYTENRPSEAEPLYEKGIPNLPATPPTLAAEKTINLALCYARDDKMDMAGSMFKRGLAAYQNALGPDSAETMAATVNYASFEFQRGNYDKAIELAEQVLRSKMATKAVKGTANNVLAVIYDKQAKYGKALRLAQRELDDFRNSHATDAVKEADALLLIGRIYAHGHKYRDAETVINKALESLAKAAPDNPDYSDALREKGDLFTQQGQYEKAEVLINQSKALRVKFLGADNYDVAQNLVDLGYIYQQQNKYSDAENSYKEALRIYKKARGEKHPSYVSTLEKLANLYQVMNKAAEAQKTLTSVLDIRRATLPDSSPEITNTIVSLATLFNAVQEPKKAEQLFTEAVARDKKLSVDQAQQAGDLTNLAAAQAAAGNATQAAETKTQADAIISTLAGSDKTSAPEQSATAPTQEKPSTGDKWCLCVGISNFKDTSINLKYSAKDATDFRNFLISKGNFKPDHVKLLVDESATRQNLIDQLGDGWLAGKVKPNDLVMVYISSHGSQALDEAKGVNFLVTYDTNKNSLLATGIPMQWLSKIIAEQVKCQRTVIMLDVCHSGSAADWSDDSPSSAIASSDSDAGGAGGKGLARQLKSDPQSIVPGSGQIILCSSSKSQTSWESQEYPNSVFTKRLMDALISKGATTLLSDSYAPLKSSVEGEVLRDRGQVQTPQISGNWKGTALTPLSQ